MEVNMFIGILIIAVIILFASAAAIQMFVSPTDLYDMGVWIDRPQF
jgi:hypothetical protein